MLCNNYNDNNDNISEMKGNNDDNNNDNIINDNENNKNDWGGPLLDYFHDAFLILNVVVFF